MQRTVILILAFLLVWSAGLPALAAPASPQPAASPSRKPPPRPAPRGKQASCFCSSPSCWSPAW